MKKGAGVISKTKRIKAKGKMFCMVIMPAVLIVAAIFVWIAADLIINISIKEAPRRPSSYDNYASSELDKLVWLYGNRGASNPDIDFGLDDVSERQVLDALAPSKRYLEERLDCADFRATYFLKLYFDGGDDLLALSQDGAIRRTIEEALTGFKFWLTSEGDDSMCYYSENHAINFAVIEYLSGIAFGDSMFSVDGKNGAEHVNIARKRIMDWLELRFTYGFSECFSANYYVVDIAALTMLLNYGDRADNSLMQKAKMVLDILFLDYALQMYDYTFISPSGRAYQYNNLCWKTSGSAQIVDYVWELNEIENLANVYGGNAFLAINNLALLKAGEAFYEVPDVIKDIGRENNKTVKTGTGLNLSDLEREGLLGQSDRQMMFQLGMGAISNPEIIQNTLDYINKYDLLTNNFLSNFKYTNIKFFQYFNLMPAFSRLVNPYTNGFANQKYNVYTYATDSFKLSTNQQYFPGSFGSQQIQSIALLPGGVPVYTTHPVDTLKATPGYWSGYGAAPHNAQHENVLLAVYKLPKRIMMAQDKPLDYTHTYFPEAEFDEIVIEGNYAFGKKGDTYIAVAGTSKLEYLARDEGRLDGLDYKTSGRFDLIQRGRNTGWMYELSDAAQDGDFAGFIARIKANPLAFDGDKITYTTSGRSLKLDYGKDFYIDGKPADTEYKRYDCEFVTADRNDGKYVFAYGGGSLTLDFENNIRDCDQSGV